MALHNLPPEPNSFADFCERMTRLQLEAQTYGIACVTVLLDDDLLRRAEDKNVLWTGGHMRSVGMLEYGKHMLLNCSPRSVSEPMDE